MTHRKRREHVTGGWRSGGGGGDARRAFTDGRMHDGKRWRRWRPEEEGPGRVSL